jgi:hypothetical protein
MYIDATLVLSDAQAITVSGASTSYIDTLSAGPEAYVGAWMIVIITTACTAAGAATVTFDLRHDAATSFATDAVLVSSGAIGKATLVAGYTFAVRLPRANCLRYVRGYATIATGPLTAGAWDIKIVSDVDRLIP